MMDGTPDGAIKASIKNWVGRIYSIPKTEIHSEELRGRPDLNHPAVYFLVGTNPETDKPRIYIGQAAPRQNGLAFARAAEHSRDEDKDFFNRIIYLVVVDDSWGATEITFLENAFHQRAIQAGRYEIANRNTPSPGSVSEEIQAELDEFIEHTNLIIGALGITAFQPKRKATNAPTKRPNAQEMPLANIDEPTFVFEAPAINVLAEGQRTPNGFLVFEGATIREGLRPSASTGVIATRERYADKVVGNRLIEDVEFTSPSAAGSFLVGGSNNGRTSWRLQTNPQVSLADWEEHEAELSASQLSQSSQ